MTKTPRTLLAATVLSVGLATAGAWAHEGATGIVKERMEFMETIGKSMKSLAAMIRGKQEYDAARVRELARTIGNHGDEKLTKLFPKGSTQHPTRARPEIWADWQRFSALAEQLTSYANALEVAADNPRMMAGRTGMGPRGPGMMGNGQASPGADRLAEMPPDAAFMHLARTCSSCHRDFRKKK